MSDDSVDMENESTKISSEPKPQPIFMKMGDNFSEIFNTLENTPNSTLEKKVNGDLIQIFSTDTAQYQSIQKFLSDNKVELFAVQPRKERPKKILLKVIPKTFSILKVKS